MKTNNKNRKHLALLAYFIASAVIIFSAIAIFIFFQQKTKLINNANNEAKKSIYWLVSTLKINEQRVVERNQIANTTFKVFLSENINLFDFTTKKTKIEVNDFSSNATSYIKIDNWKYRGDSITENPMFLKPLSFSLKNEIAIGQRTPKGYVVLVSTLPSFELKLIPFSSKFIYTIENGDMYSDIISINGKKYHITASPLYINGKIQGFYANLSKLLFTKNLTDFFLSNQYLERGYSFAMNTDGMLVIHPKLQNTSIKSTDIYKKIIKNAKANSIEEIKYIWPETKKGEEKIMFVTFLPKMKLYVGSTYYINDLKKDFRNLKIALFLAVLLSSIAFSLALFLLSNYFNKKISTINSILKDISKGIILEYSLQNSKNKEQLQPILLLSNNLNKLKEFSEHLKNQDFSFKYKKWSDNDIIGDNLIELNKNLFAEQQNALKKTEEQDKLIWLNKGLSKFIEILKYQVIEIKELAYKITSQIVEYINANEGGFFIVEKDKNGQKYINLLAAYAMHKEKLLKRRIEFGEGLIGRVAIEKKLLFLTEIPDSYYKISTALGEGKPKSIVIIPMLFNDEIIGIIELSSLSVFTKLQLEFLERISENISANLAMWRASQQTTTLLKESQEQAKIQQEQQKTLEKHLKELEKLREDSEQREIELNSIIKAVDTSALLVEYDTNGNILSANNRFLLTLGRDATEVIGKNHKDITSMDSKSNEYRNFWKELLEGNTKRFIESFDVLDNTIWLSQNYVPIIDKNNKVFKILNIAIDITENKILERQLRSQVREISKEARLVRKDQRKVKMEREEFLAKEKTYLAIIKGADKYIGHIEFTIDGKIIYINDIFGEYLGFDNVNSLIDKNIKDLIYAKELETFKLAIENVKKGEEYTSSINFYNAKGNPEELHYTLIPAFDAKNKVFKILMIITK